MCEAFTGFLLFVYGELGIGSDFARRCCGTHELGFEAESDGRGILLWESFSVIWAILDLTAEGLHFDDFEEADGLVTGFDKGRFKVLEVLGLSFSSIVVYLDRFELRIERNEN